MYTYELERKVLDEVPSPTPHTTHANFKGKNLPDLRKPAISPAMVVKSLTIVHFP